MSGVLRPSLEEKHQWNNFLGRNDPVRASLSSAMSQTNTELNDICLAIQGDLAALARLWEDHRRWLSVVILANRDQRLDVEDVLQDVAVRVIARIGSLRDPRAFRAWLRTLTLNEIRRVARSGRARKTSTSALPLDEALEVADPAPDIASATGQREQLRRVMMAVDELPLEYREPLLLKSVEGMSQRSIALALGISEKSLEARLVRGRSMLRKRIDRLDEKQKSKLGNDCHESFRRSDSSSSGSFENRDT